MLFTDQYGKRVNKKDRGRNRFTEIEEEKKATQLKKKWMKRRAPEGKENKLDKLVYVKSTSNNCCPIYPGDKREGRVGLPLYDSFSLGTLCLGSRPLPSCTAPHSSTTIPNR